MSRSSNTSITDRQRLERALRIILRARKRRLEWMAKSSSTPQKEEAKKK